MEPGADVPGEVLITINVSPSAQLTVVSNPVGTPQLYGVKFTEMTDPRTIQAMSRAVRMRSGFRMILY